MTDLEQSSSAEISIIGAIILNCEIVMPRIWDKLKAEYFGYSHLGEIYTTIRHMVHNNTPVDMVTLINGLVSKGYDESEAKKVLCRCMEECPATSNAEAYVDIIHNAYKRRIAKDTINSLLINISESSNIDETLAYTTDNLSKLLIQNGKTGLRSMTDIIVDNYSSLYDSSSYDSRIRIGIDNIDKILEGIYPSDVVVIGARPSVGKTAFALQVGMEVSQTRKVAFFNLEMSERQLLYREVSNISGVPMSNLKRAQYNDNQVTDIAMSCEILSKSNLHICDDAGVTTQDIYNMCRLQNFDLIIIDYLQLMSTPKGRKFSNRTEEVGYISREIKLIAKSLNVPIVILSQLNRVDGANQEPKLSNLRESGAIEQDADTIMLLWKHDEEKNILGCNIAKHRNGRTGKAALQFDGKYMRFNAVKADLNEQVNSSKVVVPWDV